MPKKMNVWDVIGGIGQGMSGFAAPFLGDNDWAARQQQLQQSQQQAMAEQAFRQQQLQLAQAKFKADRTYQVWQMKQKTQAMPVYTIDPSGTMKGVGYVPKGSKVISPSMMLSPEQKADIQVSTAARKDEEVRNQKIKGLFGAIDFFEEKIGEIPVGRGLGGRVEGAKTVISGKLQTNPKAAAYMSDVAGMRSQIARGLGEVGNLSEPEQKYAINLLPSLTDNLETRQQKIKNFRDYINKKLGRSGGPQITPDLQNAIQASGIKGNIKAIRLKGSK